MIQHSHFIIFKPYGYLSQFYLKNPKKKKLLGALGNFPDGTMAVGRLDEASEGLLFLTTDGKLSDFINSKKVTKEYYAQVDGIITDEAIKTLQQGVVIGLHGEKYTTKPCTVTRVTSLPNFPERRKKIRDDRHGPTSWVSITLREGKFRQVRKMTSAVGFPTLRLIRVRIGNHYIEELLPKTVLQLDNFKFDNN